MKLIRPYEILRLLGDPAVLRRQKLRAHRRIQHIQKDGRQLLVPAGVRVIAHQMANQRLGNGSIDPVHRHMVAVIGGPPKSQFRHISRSDHKGAHLIGDIHKHLGSLPGLAVLIRHIMALRVMADIPEMKAHCLPDIHLPQSGPQGLCHLAGIRVGSVRRSKAGHGHCHDLLPGNAKQIKSLCRHQQGKGRIQAS